MRKGLRASICVALAISTALALGACNKPKDEPKEDEPIEEDPASYWLLDKGWTYDYEGAARDMEMM